MSTYSVYPNITGPAEIQRQAFERYLERLGQHRSPRSDDERERSAAITDANGCSDITGGHHDRFALRQASFITCMGAAAIRAVTLRPRSLLKYVQREYRKHNDHLWRYISRNHRRVVNILQQNG